MSRLAVIIPGDLDERALALRVRKFVPPSWDFTLLTLQGKIREIQTGGDISLLAGETAALARHAEEEGCEAIATHGICDFGLEASREAVNIPVVGLGSAVFHLAYQLGDRIGVVSKSDATIPEFTRRFRLTGCAP